MIAMIAVSFTRRMRLLRLRGLIGPSVAAAFWRLRRAARSRFRVRPKRFSRDRPARRRFVDGLAAPLVHVEDIGGPHAVAGAHRVTLPRKIVGAVRGGRLMRAHPTRSISRARSWPPAVQMPTKARGSVDTVTLQVIRFDPTIRLSQAFASGPQGTGLGTELSPCRLGS